MRGRFGKWPYYVPHVRDFEGLSPYFGAHAKAAKEAKESRMGVRVPRLRDPACAGDFYPQLRDTLTLEFWIFDGGKPRRPRV